MPPIKKAAKKATETTASESIDELITQMLLLQTETYIASLKEKGLKSKKLQLAYGEIYDDIKKLELFKNKKAVGELAKDTKAVKDAAKELADDLKRADNTSKTINGITKWIKQVEQLLVELAKSGKDALM